MAVHTPGPVFLYEGDCCRCGLVVAIAPSEVHTRGIPLCSTCRVDRVLMLLGPARAAELAERTRGRMIWPEPAQPSVPDTAAELVEAAAEA